MRVYRATPYSLYTPGSRPETGPRSSIRFSAGKRMEDRVFLTRMPLKTRMAFI